MGVDLASAHFELAIADEHLDIRQRKRLNRSQFAQFCRDLPPSLVVMDACSSAHYWGRTLESWGHQVRLLPTQYVAAYVRRNKIDAADAAALIEAIRCYELRAVPIKSIDQQRLMQLHRLREQHKRTRNARLNLLHSALRELGVLMPSGIHRSLVVLREAMHASSTALPLVLPDIYARALEEVEQLQQKIRAVETALRTLTRRDPIVRDLRKICGAGPLIATALRGSVEDIERFASDRHFASWLGLTAREYSTGGRQRLGRISRRGDRYLRASWSTEHGRRSWPRIAFIVPATGVWTDCGPGPWRFNTVGDSARPPSPSPTNSRIIWATWRYQHPFDGNWQPRPTASG